MSNAEKDFRDFLFRGLLFESEANSFQRAGIQVGANSSEAEESLLKDALAPFSVQRRNQALEMARLYAVLFCFENEIRDFIAQVLEEADGPDWQDKLPPKAITFASQRLKDAQKDSWLEGQKSDLLSYMDFSYLSFIITERWDCFKPLLPSQHWIKQRMDEIEKARHFIAHNRMLLPSEFSRLYMYISDWNRQIGL